MDARRGSRHHAPAADTRFGGRVAGSGSPASRWPARCCTYWRDTAVPHPRPKRPSTGATPWSRSSPGAAAPPPRQNRLANCSTTATTPSGAHRRPATRRPLDPHGVLHHPRRPHRPHHRRNPDPQGPRRAGSAGHLRRRGFVAAEPPQCCGACTRGGPHGRLRTGPLPVVHRAPRAATTAK